MRLTYYINLGFGKFFWHVINEQFLNESIARYLYNFCVLNFVEFFTNKSEKLELERPLKKRALGEKMCKQLTVSILQKFTTARESLKLFLNA